MKLINTNKVYYDNDFEKWYFEDDEDFENAQVVDDSYVKENQELKQQLAEKDKEIEELKFEKRNTFGLIEKVSSKGQQEIRKQVCDEIKEKLKAHCDYTNDIGWYIPEEKIDIIFLDKIEKENINEKGSRTST